MAILNEDYGQTSLTMYGLTDLRFCPALMLSIKDCPMRLQTECSVARRTDSPAGLDAARYDFSTRQLSKQC
jgi:hypothetical protein